MANRDVWAVVHAERIALVEDLLPLEGEQWETASLCDGWAVRDVVAHLAATAALSKLGFAKEFVRAGFRADRIQQRQVVAARKRDPADSLAALRALVTSTASPPVPTISRIVEIVVHGEDVRRPLGIHHTYSTSYIGAAIAYLAGDRFTGGKARLAGLRLRGADVNFVVGDGPLVEGPAIAVLLAACGRPAFLPELSGPGVPELARRIQPQRFQ